MAKKEALEDIREAITTEKINPLTERLNKCYSEENYKGFQAAVKEIIDDHLKGKFGWLGFVWIATILVSMLGQKFFAIF